MIHVSGQAITGNFLRQEISDGFRCKKGVEFFTKSPIF